MIPLNIFRLYHFFAQNLQGFPISLKTKVNILTMIYEIPSPFSSLTPFPTSLLLAHSSLATLTSLLFLTFIKSALLRIFVFAVPFTSQDILLASLLTFLKSLFKSYLLSDASSMILYKNCILLLLFSLAILFNS